MWSRFDSCGGPRAGGGRGGWSFQEPWGVWMGKGGRRRGFRGGRMFEQGDLKYVILKLLEEKPRHGYEIIKELEEQSGGAYSPSAGTVYPTLQLLEDLGYASVALEEGGKKIYSITDAGRQYLDQNKSTVEDVFERISDIGASILSDAVMDINRAFRDVAGATYGSVREYHKDKDLALKVRQILEKAAGELRAAVDASRSAPPAGDAK